MRPFMLPIPLLPWPVRALWPNIIAYRAWGRITTSQIAREMVRLTDMRFFGLRYWLLHAVSPRRFRRQRRNWETVHYVEAREILERLSGHGKPF